MVIPARLLDAAKQAGGALEAFRAVARKKNAHTEHSDAAEAVLIPFRPFARAKADAAKAARDGDVRLVVAGALPSTMPKRARRVTSTRKRRACLVTLPSGRLVRMPPASPSLAWCFSRR